MNFALNLIILTLAGSPALASGTKIPLYQVNQKKGSYYSINYLTLLAAKPAVRKAVNSKIEATMMINEEPCDEAKGSDYQGNVSEITVMPGTMLSLKANQGGYCAHSAHPFSETQGLVFDLKTGTQLTLESQLKNGDTTRLDTLLLAQAKKETGSEEGCNYDDVTLRASQFTLSEGTLTVWSQLPHAMQACDTEVKIPLQDLKDVLAPGSLAERLMKALENPK
jgi:hypothetical protein